MSYLQRAQNAAVNDAITLTDEFHDAFNLLEHSRKNIFLTGKAGTGKSTFLNYFRSKTKKKIAVAAPTGIAALNIGAQTIHSLFRFAPRFVNLEAIKADRRKLFKELELLIIDEISMVRADMFDGIDHFLRLTRRSEEPFGGVQICVIGDLFQLPPVVSREEQTFFSQYYSLPFFFAARAFANASFHRIEFSTIHRQSDEAFIRILNSIRAGECSAEALALLNKRVSREARISEGTLVLTNTNALADRINADHLAHLPSRQVMYEGELQGDFALSGARLPAPEQLILKVGAQVMFVKNDSHGLWVNGTVGVVEALEENEISVRINGSTFEVEREKWQTLGYEFDEEKGKIVEKVLGQYKQFPLMTAWAVTIHKSQGKTLSRAIIDLGTGAFAPGQLYVALSRCKTLEGITLKRPAQLSDIRCDGDVVRFMRGE